MKIGIIQMDIAFGDPVQNREYVKEQVKKQMETDPVEVFVLPELWTTGYDLARFDQIAEENAAESIEFIQQLAKAYHVHFMAGSIANKKHDKFYNTFVVIDRNGEVVKQYDKAHLFRLMNEEKYLTQGDTDGLFELENQPMAGVICYDIRFPEWIRTHLLGEQKMLVVVAEWPKARIDHWRHLLITRAIESQVYVVACNRVGADPNNTFGGHSMIIDPWGHVLVEAEEEMTTLVGEVNLDDVDEIRQRIPIYQDRRPDMYRY
ncbi:Predicted amidohydrolase [Pelagirhabdus alkalitolerans]|uniref:Predicted amidohydrolase n=1 Tax=Pelagirhabdus alkalitolerans TaxID=1612202 RepID=A0A1G6GMA6_9BACI|nr:Predicted amidohydrolase [Pelagirhabdus alkalitolerans]